MQNSPETTIVAKFSNSGNLFVRQKCHYLDNLQMRNPPKTPLLTKYLNSNHDFCFMKVLLFRETKVFCCFCKNKRLNTVDPVNVFLIKMLQLAV